ncbi:MAG: hypothetical protein CVV24_02670 [Ignavibacteriae bacterium HGW-Ignavibacteriae-3]|nr:MAG: hypothetical protein CVV24_02670 [Ignavibacteriae bacterium HGW-Ignavibacteriae-3]
MFDKQKFLDFVGKDVLPAGKTRRLFSYSQKIALSDYLSLKSGILNEKSFSFYWNIPADNYSFIAAGAIYSLRSSEYKDLSTLGDDLKNLPFNVVSNNTNSDLPFFIGGVKFPSSESGEKWNDYEYSQWTIPNFLVLKNGGNTFLIINTFEEFIQESIEQLEFYQGINSYPSEKTINVLSNKNGSLLPTWCRQINSALDLISQNQIEKVVIARYNELELNEEPEMSVLLEHLETVFENCTTFAYKSKNSVFFGSSPERLLKAVGGIIETDALAGSIGRGINAEKDCNLEEELLNDEKNLSEHKSVLNFILSQLGPFTEKILFDSKPLIKKYPNIQHLYSKISAKLKKDVSFFSLLEKLFPTPAVCGVPKNNALSAIHEIEKFDRGLFAGFIGWFNLNGDADFSVGIRSALLKNNMITAYAGCGVVSGSDPVSEYNETELKLKPILNLFAHETICKS